MKIISYYTPNYAKVSENLTKSLQKLTVPFLVQPIDDQGSWDANCHYKPKFILEQLQDEDAVVWTDADSVVNAEPLLFYELDCDIAFHRFKGKELLSGTVYFKNNYQTMKLLHKWIELNDLFPNSFDQRNLDLAVLSMDSLKIYDLPPEYCCIFDLSREYHGGMNPVIEHFQASRQYR